MEIIEKQVEKVKEVPTDGYYGYGRRDVNGKANAGLTLGIIGRKYSGEKFDMYKAKEICERYRGILPTSATVADVYVAINSQYHDYAELFKDWFGDGIEQKIVESAIVFWFKDADCKAENKVVEYLGEY